MKTLHLLNANMPGLEIKHWYQCHSNAGESTGQLKVTTLSLWRKLSDICGATEMSMKCLGVGNMPACLQIPGDMEGECTSRHENKLLKKLNMS